MSPEPPAPPPPDAGPLLGIHHVTAIAGDPQRNVDFYAGVLGLRLVKRTINFDDPGTYHLYYGDAHGNPGTILTFFPWPGAQRGRKGTGQATVTAFAIPPASLDFWAARLRDHGVHVEGPSPRFDEQVLIFADHDGLALELVAREEAQGPGWESAVVPPEHTVRGVHSVTLSLEGYERTATLLTGGLGFRAAGEQGNRFRYATGDGAGTRVDLLCQPEAPRGHVAVGNVHHVAWRVRDDASQARWRQHIDGLGLNVSPVMDRQYFHSIYFREPGGVLFEIATDPPGFAVDEPAETLGSRLMLPPWVEPQRGLLERMLPPLRVPGEGD